MSALSAADAWAAGYYCRDGCHDLGTLVSHWNGTDWSQVTVPFGIGSVILSGVDATAPDNAWAAGGSVILHWNGKAWSKS